LEYNSIKKSLIKHFS